MDEGKNIDPPPTKTDQFSTDYKPSFALKHFYKAIAQFLSKTTPLLIISWSVLIANV